METAGASVRYGPPHPPGFGRTKVANYARVNLLGLVIFARLPPAPRVRSALFFTFLSGLYFRMTDDLKQEFDAARMKHLLFKSKLRSFLYGSNTEEGPIRDPEPLFAGPVDQPTGAHQAYAHLPESRELDRVHQLIHVEANRLMDLRLSGRPDEATAGLADNQPTGRPDCGFAAYVGRIFAGPVTSGGRCRCRSCMKLKLSTKLFAGFLAISALFAAVVVINYQLSRAVLRNSQRVARSQRITGEATTLLRNIIDMETGFPGLPAHRRRSGADALL